MGLPSVGNGGPVRLPHPPQAPRPSAQGNGHNQGDDSSVDTSGLDEAGGIRAVGDANGTTSSPLNTATIPSIDFTIVRTTAWDQVSQDPWLARIAPGGDLNDDIGMLMLLQIVGSVKPEDIPENKGARLGELSGLLDKMLVDGGSPQLAAYRQVRHDMNVAIAQQFYAQAGRNPAPGELDRYVQALDDMVALEIMTSMGTAKGAGALGTSTGASTIVYQGIDLKDVNLTRLPETLPSATKLATMSDKDVTAYVDRMLGTEGGGSAMAARRELLRDQGEAALAAFDRGLLTTILTTVKAVKSDPGYARDLGINTSGHREIPAEYRGSLLMMIAYVFAMKDKELSELVKDDIENYDRLNGDLHDALDDDNVSSDKSDPLRNEITGAQMKTRADLEMLTTNSEMGASLISKLGDAQGAVWRK